MPITHPPSTFMTRGARSFMLVGKALVEDVVGQRDVIVGREHLRARRQPDVDDGPGCRSFGAPKPSGGYVSVLELPVISPASPRLGGAGDYFGFVAIVNGSLARRFATFLRR